MKSRENGAQETQFKLEHIAQMNQRKRWKLKDANFARVDQRKRWELKGAKVETQTRERIFARTQAVDEADDKGRNRIYGIF